ncbi:unnamed protein product [Alopecurus aequalis]
MSKFFVSPASFRAPAIPDPAGASRARPSVLLDPMGYLANGENETTAQAETSKGQVVQVSFTLADPPAVSYMCVQCPGMEVDDFAAVPVVLCADGPFVLLAVTFISCPSRPVSVRCGSSECFVYRAGPGEPSLELIPRPHFACPFPGNDIGIVHCADGQFVIATLEVNLDKGRSYDLHLFSRESNVWITKRVTRDLSCDWGPAMFHFHTTSKVVAVGGGKLAWVDRWRGILVCDVLRTDDDPFMRFISLPDPMESNKEDDYNDACPRSIRDITFTNGSFKFVEMEFLDDGDDDAPDAWTATVWKKKTLSGDWQILHFIHIDDVSVSTRYSDMLPELWDDKAMKPSLTKLATASPTLPLLDDNVVYMMSRVDFDDPRAWMIAVDMTTKEMVQMIPFCADRISNVTVNYHPFTFSSYVTNAT